MAQPSERKIGLRFEKIDKRYGSVYALRNLNMTVAPGECVALTGRNGSGKTTLLRIASHLTKPTRGAFSFSGVAESDRPQVGFVAHATMVYDELSAEENLLFFARLLGVPDSAGRVKYLLDEVGLRDRKDSLVRTFSRGMRQRVAIARALLADPPLLLFDEPATGLDPEATAWFIARLRTLRDAGRTILMSLHGESEVAHLATRAVRLDGGSAVADTRAGATFRSVFSLAGG
ncbi:MAG TPA: ABC transporter ATP-binding protein [Candidatus Acidoferrum sp.]